MFLPRCFVTALVCLAFVSISTSALTIKPSSATVQESATRQFTASVPSMWKTTCGTISAAGFFRASLYAATNCVVIATPKKGGATVSVPITVVSPIAISPAGPQVVQGHTQQFKANMAVNWMTRCGSITATGLYLATSPTRQRCTIEAVAKSAPHYTAYSYALTVPVARPAIFELSPQRPTVLEGVNQQFNPRNGATYRASCGSITSTGLFTAPLSAGSCTITAREANGSGRIASAAVTVRSPLSIAPSIVSLHALNSLSFTASRAVTWSASCGSISAAGLFKAPGSATTCRVFARASSGPAYTAQATVKVDVVNYTAWKGGAGATGAQTQETSLSPATVGSRLGMTWSANVDGWVSAQPLYMNGLAVNGLAHNVVFVATANDSVYAFDGDTGAQLWHVSLHAAGATAVSGSQVGMQSAPLIGILSTPVIDPTTKTMYVVAETSEQNGTYFPHRLHALDLATGKEKLGGPVLISHPDMAPMHKLQRPGLTLANGSVYIAFGSLEDISPYHGLLFAFNAQTLDQEAVWVTTPSGSGGGIWMGGAAPSVDEEGNLYVAVGDGSFDGTTGFGEAVVKLSPNLQVLDYFAPYNWSSFDSNNIDLGSGNVMVVTQQNGPHPRELIACGKPTPIYVLDRDNLGKAGKSSDMVIQRLDKVVGRVGPSTPILEACFTTPAMWGQNIYFGGKYDVLKMFTLDPNTGLLSSSPVSQGGFAYQYPGADPVVSANGSTNGIVWTVDTGTGTLRAADATNVSKELYSGSLGARAVRWSVPTVVNSHVYVGAQGKVVAFGLH